MGNGYYFEHMKLLYKFQDIVSVNLMNLFNQNYTNIMFLTMCTIQMIVMKVKICKNIDNS